MPQLIATVEGVEIKRVFLKKDRTTLGRKPHNDIVLENMVVSGEHCVFDLDGIADVYIEDLHTTNGTAVNGSMIRERRKLLDQDLISIGGFRIRFLSASERPGEGETVAMKLEAEPSGFVSSGFEPSGFSPSTFGASAPPATPAAIGRSASFSILTGSSAGRIVPIVKAVMTFGKPGVAVVAVTHRRTGFFVAHLDGDLQPLLNGRPVPADALPLAHQDILELAGTKMQFHLGSAVRHPALS